MLSRVLRFLDVYAFSMFLGVSSLGGDYPGLSMGVSLGGKFGGFHTYPYSVFRDIYLL